MQPLYLFAPENDMALAFGGKYYTPAPVGRCIAHDLSLLPLWYAAGDNAAVWSEQQIPDEMREVLIALGITSYATTQLPCHDMACRPWGWSAYIVERLARMGVARHLLPDDEAIDKIRALSGRATSRHILQALQQSNIGYPLPPLPEVLHTALDVEQYIASQPASILKSPWSSSGRGVWNVEKGYDTSTARYAESIIRKQGYIMGERLLDKVVDLAMEFYSDGTTVEFAGYSLFTTDERGAYQGNILASNSDIEHRLATYIEVEYLHATQRALEEVLTTIVAPHYKGYMGIDMILYRNEANKILLHPCIELNLRMSMGMVARIIADRYLSPLSHGKYHVAYMPEGNRLQELHATLAQEHPLRIDNHKIAGGYLALTPVTPDTHYLAYIVVEA